MRCSAGFVFALTLAGLPLSVSAQTGEEGTKSEANLREPALPSEPAPEEPALQLKLDSAGVEVAPGYPPRLDELELRVKRAKIGLGASAGVLALGIAFTVGDNACNSRNPPPEEAFFQISEHCSAFFVIAAMATIGGLVGMIVNGVRLAKHKRELRELQRAHYRTPRRAQWDLAQSRLVF